MAPEGEHGVAAAQRGADRAEPAELVDRVVDDRVLDPDVPGPEPDRPPAEIGVLAERLGEGLVEAVEAGEQLGLIGDVAGLEPRSRLGDRARAGEGPQALALARDRAGRALHDRPGVRPRGAEQALEPVRGRLAVVVGERDPGAARGPPAAVAGSRGPAAVARQRPQVEPPALALEHRRGLRRRAVVDDHDLERLGERLGAEALQQARQPPGPVAGGDHDADRRFAHAATTAAARPAPARETPGTKAATARIASRGSNGAR